ncbi:uncharacterized protein BO87DRAFT_6796 [Aspergillus neoniger CBS 115656]|uniref:Uncharacterized protein n=1 Tax=Aspergillus neoniger (strain CBS 115656) TaxID=1448310 RepID=A0A318ZHU3_ASPNB|nr:hypothetical protein BO87DRAFT_6796 [Aspergillus neoniger CBS 115656]PYH39808.1 hypothetical protein BO87DRAFT_6796 [Aspergillus neoniger CBS 115656]
MGKYRKLGTTYVRSETFPAGLNRGRRILFTNNRATSSGKPRFCRVLLYGLALGGVSIPYATVPPEKPSMETHTNTHTHPSFPPTYTTPAERTSPKIKEMMYRSLLLESVLPYETRLTIRPSSTLEPHIPSTAYRSPTSVLRYFCLGRVTSAKSSTFFTLRGSSLRSTQEEENKPGGTPSHRQLVPTPLVAQ